MFKQLFFCFSFLPLLSEIKETNFMLIEFIFRFAARKVKIKNCKKRFCYTAKFVVCIINFNYQ